MGPDLARGSSSRWSSSCSGVPLRPASAARNSACRGEARVPAGQLLPEPPPRVVRARPGRRGRPGRPRERCPPGQSRGRRGTATRGAGQAEREAARRGHHHVAQVGGPHARAERDRALGARPAGRRRGGRGGSGRARGAAAAPAGGRRPPAARASRTRPPRPAAGETGQPVTSRQNSTPASYAAGARSRKALIQNGVMRPGSSRGRSRRARRRDGRADEPRATPGGAAPRRRA